MLGSSILRARSSQSLMKKSFSRPNVTLVSPNIVKRFGPEFARSKY